MFFHKNAFWHQIFTILMIYALFMQNVGVTICALFPSISYMAEKPLPPTHSPFGCMQTPTGLPLVSFLYCSSGKYSHSQAGSATGWVDGGGRGAYSWGSTSDAGSTLTRYNDTLIHPFTEKPACRDICLSATYTALSMWYEERQQMGFRWPMGTLCFSYKLEVFDWSYFRSLL